jgi:dTDP-4-amino-4,6-dideoxygalactose transaminase
MREFGSEHPAVILPDGYFDSFEELGHCTWLRSGREALHLIALYEKPSAEDGVILMPAYCCHSMIHPFEKAGWKIVFYPLNEDLTVDIESLSNLLLKFLPKAVLTMNYYGAASTYDAVNYIKKEYPACICIEDFSHCTFSIRSIFNSKVDYYVSSIRKSVGVSDGSVIISRNPLDESSVSDEETEFTKTRRDVQKLKGRYAYTHEAGTKNIFLSQLRMQEVALDNFDGVYTMSITAQQQLKMLNGHEIALARQKNMEHLLSLLKGKVRMVPGIEKYLGGAPFSLPILVENRDEIQKKLAASGVYAPVLWPISDEARKACTISALMADKMLSIPIDQRYSWDDIEDIAKIIITVVK